MTLLEVGDFGYDGKRLLAQVAGAVNEEYVLDDEGNWVANDYDQYPPAPDWVSEELTTRALVFLVACSDEDYLVAHATMMYERNDPPAMCGVERVIEGYKLATRIAKEALA